MNNSFGNYNIGDRIKFLDDGLYVTGVIEQLTEHQVVIRPDDRGGAFHGGYRMCLSRSDLAVKLIRASSFDEMIVDDDGSVSL